jgi:hypothetical protein
MNKIQRPFVSSALAALLITALIWTVPAGAAGTPQIAGRAGTIDSGTTVYVRTNEEIEAKKSDGRVYKGVVDQDVLDQNDRVIIPSGSDVELIVREVGDDDLALDLESITVNGRRYAVEAEENIVGEKREEGIGANKRTATHVGGGAALGAIIGAIAGGGKGAAIGAGVGAAGGAGVQVLTRGKKVEVPAESLLTYRLTEPLRAGIPDNGYMRNGIHYHHLDNTDFDE